MSGHGYLTISAREARRRGYRPLTRGCRRGEFRMLLGFVEDMMRGGIEFVLVHEEGTPDAVAVYRKPGKAANRNGRAA